MQRILLFANGEYSSVNFYKNLIKEDDYIICADGGANLAYSIGLLPDLVIGDFDSIDDGILKKLKLGDTEFFKFPSEKDESDLELAIKKAIGMSPREIVILGALGKRLDHIIANLMLLTIPLESGIKCSILEEDYEIYLIDSYIKIQKAKGSYISLFPLSSVVEGVESRGLKYSLQDENLYLGPSRGLSNELVEEEAIIKIKSGKLLVIKTNN